MCNSSPGPSLRQSLIISICSYYYYYKEMCVDYVYLTLIIYFKMVMMNLDVMLKFQDSGA